MMLSVCGVSVSPINSAVELVHDVNLNIDEGARLGVVGRSGSGKSTLVRAVAGFLPPREFTQVGTISLGGASPVEIGAARHRDAARRQVSVIWQDSLSALNPCQSVRTQLVDTLRLHTGCPRRQALANAQTWLERVGFEDPRHVLTLYPHEMSGGMRQRVSIALGLCGNQPLVVADEPTTALDTVGQAECIRLLDRLCAEDHRALLFISHDVALVAWLCSQVIVLDGGRVVEQGMTPEVLACPATDCTRAMVERARMVHSVERGAAWWRD